MKNICLLANYLVLKSYRSKIIEKNNISSFKEYKNIINKRLDRYTFYILGFYLWFSFIGTIFSIIYFLKML